VGGLKSHLYHEGGIMAKAKISVKKIKSATIGKKLESSEDTKVSDVKETAGKHITNVKKPPIIENGKPDTNNSTQTKSNTNAKAGLPTEALAKAGKRSAKALKEDAEKQAKEERKAKSSEVNASDDKPKPKQRIAKPKIERRSKKYKEAAKLIDKNNTYTISEGIVMAAKTSTTKFDATLELHIRLNVDPKQADQNIRNTVVLPAGTGKTIKVAVYCEPDDVAAAKKAGADIAGGDEFLENLNDNTCDFDVLIATPSVMPKLGKFARLLGPKGLMPNLKSGTITKDITKTVKEAKAGKVEYRVDSYGIIHSAVGKVSFGADKLTQNVFAIIDNIRSNKPSSIKGTYIESMYITTTMGPSVKVDPLGKK